MRYITICGFLVLVLSSLTLNCSNGDSEEMPIQFEAARLNIEVNNTDGDLGIQLFFDGGPWTEVKLFNPDGKLLYDVQGKGDLKDLGLTEHFFESEEPVFRGPDADTTIAELLANFPEGEYKLEGKTVDGGKIEGTAVFSHIIPCGPVITSPAVDATGVNPANTIITWITPTTKITPETGECDAPLSPDVIIGYEVIVERAEEEFPPLHLFTLDIPASITSVQVPPGFLEPSTAYKFEVLAILNNDGERGNQTLTEQFFTTSP